MTRGLGGALECVSGLTGSITSLRADMDHLQNFNRTCVQQLHNHVQASSALQQQRWADGIETQQRQAAEDQAALVTELREACHTIAEVSYTSHSTADSHPSHIILRRRLTAAVLCVVSSSVCSWRGMQSCKRGVRLRVRVEWRCWRASWPL